MFYNKNSASKRFLKKFIMFIVTAHVYILHAEYVIRDMFCTRYVDKQTSDHAGSPLVLISAYLYENL